MTLTLSVLRCPDAVPPETKRISGGEFRIGRGPDNDWIMPDPDRMLSKKHCVIAFRNGGWAIADTSTNGTFLNRDAEPIGNGQIRGLQDGDRIRFGAYEIEVRVEQESSFAQPRPSGAYGASQSSPFDDPFGDDVFATRPPPAETFTSSAFGNDPLFGGPSPKDSVTMPTRYDPMAPPAEEDFFAAPTVPDHSPAYGDAFRPPPVAPKLIPDDDWDLGLPGVPTPVTPSRPPAQNFAPPSPLPPQAYAPPPTPTPQAYTPPPQPFTPPPQPAQYAPPPAPASPAGQFPGPQPVFSPAPPPAQDSPFGPPTIQPNYPTPQQLPEPVFQPPAVPQAYPPPPPAPPQPAAPPPAYAPPAALSPFTEPQDLVVPPTPFTPPSPPPAPPQAAPPPPASYAPPPVNDDLLAAFLVGAGMTGRRPENPAATMSALGAAFRAVVSGIRQALIARASIKGEFRIEQTMIRARGNNPLKFSADDEDALSALLGVGRRIDMTPEAAVADALRDMRLHELATVAAMQGAVRTLLAGLDPAKLLADATGGMLPAQKRAKAFDAYEKLHETVTRALADDFDSVFGKAFARAYETALRDISAKDT